MLPISVSSYSSFIFVGDSSNSAGYRTGNVNSLRLNVMNQTRAWNMRSLRRAGCPYHHVRGVVPYSFILAAVGCLRFRGPGFWEDEQLLNLFAL